MKNEPQFSQGDGNSELAWARLDELNELFGDVPLEERDQVLEQAWFRRGPTPLEFELLNDGPALDRGTEFVEGVRETVDERDDEIIRFLLEDEPRQSTRKAVRSSLDASALTRFYQRHARACLIAAGFLVGAIGAGSIAYATLQAQEKQETIPLAAPAVAAGQALSQNDVSAVVREVP